MTLVLNPTEIILLKKIWGIPHIHRHLGNFPDSQVFGKFPRIPSTWGISEITQIALRI